MRSQRLQLIVIVWATRSTSPVSSAGQALGEGDHPVLDRQRVDVAEDRPGDLLEDRRCRSPRARRSDRVAGAELQGAGRDADDQPAAVAGSPPSSSRPASRRAAAAGRPGRTSGSRRGRPPRPCTRAGAGVTAAVVGGAVTSGGAASCGAPQAVMVASSEQARAERPTTHHRYSRSRCPKPTSDRGRGDQAGGEDEPPQDVERSLGVVEAGGDCRCGSRRPGRRRPRP